MSTAAPALGGASSSAPRPTHSAWNPYTVLPATTKKKLDPSNVLPPDSSFLSVLKIPSDVAAERLDSKFLQLDAPEGKVSDRRKAQLALRAGEKEARRVRRQREVDCGLVGKRRRGKGKQVVEGVRYAALVPIHQLWLGYMSELLSLPIRVDRPTSQGSPPSQKHESATILPTFPPRSHDLVPAGLGTEMGRINVQAIQMKLVKAEFVGSILTVKRAKNPSLRSLKGIVLQETQSTFKIVTAQSTVKILPKQGSIFEMALPLVPLPGGGEVERELRLDIYGDAFAYRSADRVGKKWKAGSSMGGVELK